MELDDQDRVSRPYEAGLERTVQELNNRKRQLEDSLHEVCVPVVSQFLLTKILWVAEGICSGFKQ